MVRNYIRKTEVRWTHEDLLEALKTIYDARNNGQPINIVDVARSFNISKATLYRRYPKFVQGGCLLDTIQFRSCGGIPIVTPMEERVLETCILNLRKQMEVKSVDIRRIFFEYVESNSIPHSFDRKKRLASYDWYSGFIKRHPSIRITPLRMPNKTSLVRATKKVMTAVKPNLVIKKIVKTKKPRSNIKIVTKAEVKAKAFKKKNKKKVKKVGRSGPARKKNTGKAGAKTGERKLPTKQLTKRKVEKLNS